MKEDHIIKIDFDDIKNEKYLNPHELDSYVDYLLDSFLIEKAERYDVKEKKYIQTPHKYYFADIGLRNARLNFVNKKKIILWKISFIMSY